MLEKKYSFQKKLTQLLKYPIALSMFVLLLFVFIQNFLLPQFIQMYISMEAKQSPFMTLMITLPQYYLEITIFISSFFFLFILTYLLYFRKKSEKRKMLYVLRIPILGKIMRLKNTQYFSVQLSCLLKGGLSVLEVLSVFEEQRHLPFFKEEARQLKTMLTEGESLDNIINDSPFYEKDLSSVVTHGQANGMLAAALSDYSELLVDRIEIRVNEITACIQPIVFLVLSSFVILVYLSMMLPLVQMMENL